MKIINKKAVDYELQEDTEAVVTFDMVLQALTAKVVNRKPENQRTWKWWEGWTTYQIQDDTVIQDPDGVQFRVRNTVDWSRGGFYHIEMTEQPLNLDQPEDNSAF